MVEILTGAQIFDLTFHPTHSTVYTGLLTGHINAFSYDDQGQHKRVFSLRPSKRSCRALAINEDGSHLYAVGKSKALNIIDTVTEDVEIRSKAHDSSINRIKYLLPSLLCTGDDDGVIKLWDPRQRECTRCYKQHFDYITDFLWLGDKKHLVATSGDGTLSVMDIRSKKPEPIAHSEDQEDELLSIVAIKGATKVVVGTQIGILSIFNLSSGWGDCVDRIPGHPHSVEALCGLPSSLPNVDATSTILTGSSDGFVRAVQILPTKLLGVVADHGDWPVERIAIGHGASQSILEEGDEGNESGGHVDNKTDEERELEEARRQQRRRWWVGSIGHEETLKMTDLEAFFHERQLGRTKDTDGSVSESRDRSSPGEGEDGDFEGISDELVGPGEVLPTEPDRESESDGEEPEPIRKKRRRKQEKNPLAVKKKGRNTLNVEPTFFHGL